MSADEHPAPWRWVERIRCLEETTWLLIDANDDELVAPTGDDWSFVDVPSPRVRALTAAAPEMEALLRWERFGDECRCLGSMLPECQRPKCWNCKRRALIARIDEAAKGT